MSGFVNNTGGGLRFVQTIGGRFRMTAKPEELELYADAKTYPGVLQKRINKKGEELTELTSDKIVGHLCEVGERVVPYDPGKENYVTIQDDEGIKYRVNLSHQGRGIFYVLKRLPNIREDLPIELGIFELAEVNAKGEPVKRAQIYIRQIDESGTMTKVLDAYPFDKENPEASPLPAFRQFAGKGGKTEWDPTPQYDWLMANSAPDYLGRVSELQPKAPAPAPANVAPPQAANTVPTQAPAATQQPAAGLPEWNGLADETDDDLPF